MLGDLLSPLHIALLLIVALLIFGPRRLPELGSAVGRTIREFQKSMSEARAHLSTMTSLEEPKDEARPVVDAGQPATGDSGKPN